MCAAFALNKLAAEAASIMSGFLLLILAALSRRLDPSSCW